MRPASETRQALLQAAHELHSRGYQPTLRELAHHACVGLDAATNTIKNMCRSGVLAVAGDRRVAYRNRPVAVYQPAGVYAPAHVNLAHALQAWAH